MAKLFSGDFGDPLRALAPDNPLRIFSTLGMAVSTTFLDSVFKLLDDVDQTKALQFQLSGLTTGTTRTLTVPDVDSTLATLLTTHDAFAGVVADQHVAHSGVVLTAGTGLTGGGNIAASRTFDVAGLTATEFASADFADNVWKLHDNLDPTKFLDFQLSGVTTGTTRSVTATDANGVMALFDAAPTANSIPFVDASGRLSEDTTFVRTATGIGVGTASPLSPLHVKGVFTVQSAGGGVVTSSITVLGANDVGITDHLHVGAGVFIRETTTARSRGMDLSSGHSGNLGILAGGVDRIAIDSTNGGVTIGAIPASAAARLHVAGLSDEIQFIAQANATQTGNIIEVQNSGGTAQVVVDENYRLGVGTASPSAKLHVRGNAIQFGDSSDTGVLNFEHAVGDIRWQLSYSGTSFQVKSPFSGITMLTFLRDSGRVGVHDATPDALFHVKGTADEIQFIAQANATQTGNILEVQNSGGTAQVVVDENYRLGVGTASPDSIFHVVKDQNSVSKMLFVNENAGAAAEAILSLRNGATDSDSLDIGCTGTGYGDTGLFVKDAGYVSAGPNLSGGLSLIARASAPITFGTNGHTNERMRITSAGDIGVGTASPDSIFHVVKDQNSVSKMLFVNENVGASAEMIISLRNGATDSDSLDIGCTGTGYIGVGLFVTDVGYVSAGPNLSGGLSLIARASAPITFGTNGHTNERMRIDAAGLVGIAETSPGALLHVAGKADEIQFIAQANATQTADILQVQDSAGNPDIFAIDSAENLHLGQSSSSRNEVWNAAYHAIMTGTASIWANRSQAALSWLGIAENVYMSASNAPTYVVTDVAVEYRQINGEHVFRVAPSGTADTAITFTDGLLIDNAGNLHLGQPSSSRNEVWNAAYHAIMTGTASIWANRSQAAFSWLGIAENVYMSASNAPTYVVTDVAVEYRQINGEHVFRVAPSGTADTAITFTNGLLIDNAGNVGVNDTAPGDTFTVDGAITNTGVVDDGNSGATKTLDWTTGNSHKLTLTAACTLTMTATAGSARCILRLIQDGTGGWAVTWPSNVKLAGGAYTVSVGAGNIDTITFDCDGTDFHEVSRSLLLA